MMILELSESLQRSIDREIDRLDSEGAKKMAISVADQFREEGLQKRLQKGIRKTAVNLLKMGVDLEFVIRATGLTEDEVRQLQESFTDKGSLMTNLSELSLLNDS